MFINFTNHPSAKWSSEQREAAETYGEIRDMPFPDVEPDGDEEYVSRLAEQYVTEILASRPAAVLCQGEMTLSFAVADALRREGITVLAACSERATAEKAGANGETIKTIEFRFVRFRKYCFASI